MLIDVKEPKSASIYIQDDLSYKDQFFDEAEPIQCFEKSRKIATLSSHEL